MCAASAEGAPSAERRRDEPRLAVVGRHLDVPSGCLARLADLARVRAPSRRGGVASSACPTRRRPCAAPRCTARRRGTSASQARRGGRSTRRPAGCVGTRSPPGTSGAAAVRRGRTAARDRTGRRTRGVVRPARCSYSRGPRSGCPWAAAGSRGCSAEPSGSAPSAGLERIQRKKLTLWAVPEVVAKVAKARTTQ